MKKLIAILLTLAICFTFVSCAGTKIPEGFTVVSDVKGVTFAVPDEIANLTADNELYSIVSTKSTLRICTKKELAEKYVYKDAHQFGYLSQDDLIISVIPIDSDMTLQVLYDSERLGEYLGIFFNIVNVEVVSKGVTNMGDMRLAVNINAIANQYGEMSGNVVIIEKGEDLIGILALAPSTYREKVGEDVAKDTLNAITKTFTLTGEDFAEPLYEETEKDLIWFDQE